MIKTLDDQETICSVNKKLVEFSLVVNNYRCQCDSRLAFMIIWLVEVKKMRKLKESLSSQIRNRNEWCHLFCI